MALQTQSIREARRDQIFPKLDELEIERVRRFGDARLFAAGESLWTVGQVAAGLMVIVTGKVAVAERDQFDNHKPIVIHGPGNFLGELALLSGRPALVDAIAQESGEALIIPPERLRALMIAEAELGERIMRALILRRMAILEAGVGGPIILGRPENGDVLRLEGFLRRNGHPHQLFNPEPKDLILVVELRHGAGGAGGLVAVVCCDEPELAAEDAASGIRRAEGRLDTELHGLAEFLGRAAERCRDSKPNFSIGHAADDGSGLGGGDTRRRAAGGLRSRRRSRDSGAWRTRLNRSRAGIRNTGARRVRFLWRFCRRELGRLCAGARTFAGERWKLRNHQPPGDDADHQGNCEAGGEPSNPPGRLRDMDNFRLRAE